MSDRRLHIAVDGRELVADRPTGVGRYVREVLGQWALSSRHRFTIVLPADPSPGLRALGDRFEWRVEAAQAAGTWWEQTRLSRAVSRVRADVLFAPGYTAPLWISCPAVPLVHDVSFWAHPEWFTWREGARRRWLTRASARRASRVVTVSEFSRTEIQRCLGVRPDRIVIAPPGAPAEDPVGAHARPPIVLYVGSLFNRRRLSDMIGGFAAAAQSIPDARLILVGDNRTVPRLDPHALAARHGVQDRVEWRAYVTDIELDRLYRAARVFIFLSDYEGFGMTPLEAMTHGVPPVVLDTPVSREVYGDGCVRVAADPVAIGGAVRRLLTDDRAHADVLMAGRSRLRLYSWARSAGVIERALEEVAG